MLDLPDDDLFAWADRQPTGVVIHAEKIFERKAINFVRLLRIGYRPKVTGGEIVVLADRRAALGLPASRPTARKRRVAV